jgi:hypothetical protein
VPVEPLELELEELRLVDEPVEPAVPDAEPVEPDVLLDPADRLED